VKFTVYLHTVHTLQRYVSIVATDKHFPPPELSLWGTGIGNTGTTALAGALKQNTTLKNLWLGECENISDEGATTLKDMLSENSTLDQLALVMTGVSDELQDELEELVSARRVHRAMSESQTLRGELPLASL